MSFVSECKRIADEDWLSRRSEILQRLEDLEKINRWYKSITCKKCVHPERSCICEIAGAKMPYREMRGDKY